MLRTLNIGTLVAASVFFMAGSLNAALVGNSSLIDEPHYADSFTIPGPNGRNNSTVFDSSNSALAVNTVEQNFSNPSRQWQIVVGFAYRDLATSYGGLGGGTGNSGSTSGFWETGGGDVAHEYGLSNDYVVQVDSILPGDRLNITSAGTTYNGIFSTNSISAFFRRSNAAIEIGIFNGTTETDTGFETGIAADDNNWHNYAVRFNRTANEVSFYVDESHIGTLDVSTFAGGIYQNYDNDYVGFGGTFVTEVDNYQVGTFLIPEPASGSLLLAGLASLVFVARRRQ